MISNKGFLAIGAKARLSQNPDVGPGNILAAARTMDPPQLRNEGHGQRGNDFGPKPGTANE